MACCHRNVAIGTHNHGRDAARRRGGHRSIGRPLGSSMMPRFAQNPLPQRYQNQFDIGGDAKLGLDEIAGIRHRLRAEMKNTGDVLGRPFREQQAQNLEEKLEALAQGAALASRQLWR